MLSNPKCWLSNSEFGVSTWCFTGVKASPSQLWIPSQVQIFGGNASHDSSGVDEIGARRQSGIWDEKNSSWNNRN